MRIHMKPVQSCYCWVSICAVFFYKLLYSLSMPLVSPIPVSPVQSLYQMWNLAQTSGVCMQVVSKHNRSPELNWLEEKRWYFSCGIGAHPSDVADPSTPFSLARFSFPLSPPLVSLNLSFLPFSPSNWALNSCCCNVNINGERADLAFWKKEDILFQGAQYSSVKQHTWAERPGVDDVVGVWDIQWAWMWPSA